ncbi:MAG: hypothetical protein U0521_16750 [Anaerolineae bacterium]
MTVLPASVRAHSTAEVWVTSPDATPLGMVSAVACAARRACGFGLIAARASVGAIPLRLVAPTTLILMKSRRESRFRWFDTACSHMIGRRSHYPPDLLSETSHLDAPPR